MDEDYQKVSPGTPATSVGLNGYGVLLRHHCCLTRRASYRVLAALVLRTPILAHPGKPGMALLVLGLIGFFLVLVLGMALMVSSSSVLADHGTQLPRTR